jgi:hypothetical protein
MPGVTAMGIKSGGIYPFGGPMSFHSPVRRGAFHKGNDEGGANGREIHFIA